MAAVDDGVLGVELAVGELVGLGDALDALDDVHALEDERVDARGVADDADDGLLVTRRDVGPEPTVLDPADEMVELLGRGRFLDDSNHVAPWVVTCGAMIARTCYRLVAHDAGQSAILSCARAHSSVDESVCLRSRRSWVRIPLGAPLLAGGPGRRVRPGPLTFFSPRGRAAPGACRLWTECIQKASASSTFVTCVQVADGLAAKFDHNLRLSPGGCLADGPPATFFSPIYLFRKKRIGPAGAWHNVRRMSRRRKR